MDKPKTIKTVMAWAVTWKEHDHSFATADVYATRREAQNNCYVGDGLRVQLVEIRDAATAKLERAALDALCMYERTSMQKHLDEAKELARQIMGKAVRRG
jgi:hypothetical protein